MLSSFYYTLCSITVFMWLNFVSIVFFFFVVIFYEIGRLFSLFVSIVRMICEK